MKSKRGLSAILLVVFLLASAVLMYLANGIQHDGGAVAIENGVIESELGNIVYKLYKPAGASADAKAPAVLLLHGYQNDHETNAAYAIELARRGAVVLSIDEYGHGLTEIGLRDRGYVNHKVSVNYGLDSEEDGTFVKVGGSVRYRVLMNFSNLSFFDDKYTKDEAGNSVSDSSCGGITAYAYLAGLDYVDETRMAVSGHSMGTWSSWSVAAAFSESVNEAGESIAPKAIVLQCGELFTDAAYDAEKIHFNNVLLLQAKYDEFSYFRDYQPMVTEETLKTPLRYGFLGTDADQAAWNTTFGSFADGSARRMELLNTNHRLTTHNRQGLATALEWFDQAVTLPNAVDYASQTAMNKEWMTFLAMLLVLAAMFPFMELLLGLPMFRYVAQQLPDRDTMKPKVAWWRAAVITVLVSGLTFPFMTQLGHALLPLPEGIFRMTVGNGFIGWYLLLILVMIVTMLIGKAQVKKRGERYNWNLQGLGTPGKRYSISAVLLIKSLILAFLMVGLVYVVNLIYYKAFDLDLRIIWPFFRPMNGMRTGQFFVYILFFMVFYVLNNSKIMAGLRTKATYKPGFGGFLGDWFKNFLLMAGGVLLVVLIEYIPFFAGIGPGADLLFGSTFGGPFMSILILFVPQVLFFSIACTITYRRTGNVYTGAFVSAMLACWIVTGGSSFL